MKIKHFSHSDLDGIGAIVLSLRAFGAENVDYEICENSNANQKIWEFADQYAMGEVPEYDMIVITDLPINAFEASVLDGLRRNYDANIVHLDHHDAPWMMNQQHGATFFSMYDWSTIVKEKERDGETVKVCGTSLWYDKLVEMNVIDPTDLNTFLFSETVRSWDTWEWARTENTFPRDLNTVFQLLGKEKFLERFSKDINLTLRYEEKLLLEAEQARVDRYTAEKLLQVKKYQTGSGLTAAVVYAEQYISNLGHLVCKVYPDVDLALIIDPGKGTVSLRSEKKEIDLGELARRIGGGGREDTAGAPLTDIYTSTLDLSKL